MIQNQVAESATHQPGMSTGNFDIWEWSAWGIGIVVTTLAGIVTMFWRAIENRNARDIKSLTEQCERLQKELDAVNQKLIILMVANQRLESEKAAAIQTANEHKMMLEQYRRDHSS